MFSNRSEQITQGQFHRSFRNLIVLTWVLPAIVGLSFILAIGVLSLEQMVGILLTPFEPLYIIGWLVFSVWYFTRYVRPIEAYIAQPVKTSESIQILLVTIRGFPLRYWSFFLLYLVVAPATVIWSAEWFTDYVARPVDWFRIELIALIVSIIVGLPIFFLIFDLFGRVLGNIPLTRPFITVKTKVFLIGALVPLLIDTILVQYYWTRTGLFTFETFLVWLSLEILAIGASLIFVRSFAQSLFPLEELFSGESDYHLASTSKLVPASTDEIGVLTVNYRHLIDDLNLAREVLELRNHLLRQYGNLESIGQVAEAVVNISQETLEADEVLLLLRDKTASRLLCVARSGHSYCGEGFFDLALREGSVIEAVMQSQQTRVIADLAVEAVAGKDLASHLQAESMIIGPLAVEGISIGVLILANQRHSPDYMEREISLLEGITVEAALMLRNLQLRGLHDSAVAEKTEREARIALLMDFTEEGIFWCG